MATPKKKPEDKKKRGRKAQLLVDVTPELIERVKEMSAQGMTQFYIAAYFGLSQTTWYERCKIYPKLSEAYWAGKAKGVEFATDCLKKIMAEGNERAIMFYLRNIAKFSDLGEPDDEMKKNKEPDKLPLLKAIDPIEASRIYQSIMGGGN